MAAATGLKRLFRFDAAFAQWFDRTPAGALRSFGLMIPTLPLFLILRFVEGDVLPEAGAFRVVAVTMINYVLGWVMFPLILILIGRAIGREMQAIGAIACYNWFCFAFAIVASALVLVGSTGMLGDTLGIFKILLVLGSLVYEGYLLRILMGVGYGGAALLAVVDYTLTQSLYYLMMSPVMQAPVG